MSRIAALLACLACVGSQSSALRKSSEGRSNATVADVRTSSKPLAALLLAVNEVNAAQPSSHLIRHAKLQFTRSPKSYYPPSHQSRATSPCMTYETGASRGGPVIGPPRVAIRDHTSAWVMIFNEGKPNEGVYSLEAGESSKTYLVAFESKSDAERFGVQLHFYNLDHPTPTKWPTETLTEFCEQQQFDLYFVPEGTCISPPENNQDDVEAYRAHLERMFESDESKKIEETRANLERLFNSHDDVGSPEDVANLERQLENSPNSSYDIRGIQKTDALKRFIRQHHSRIAIRKSEQVLRDLPVGWLVLFNPDNPDSSLQPIVTSNDQWQRLLHGVPELSALVFKDQEDARLFADQLNSEEIRHTLGSRSIKKALVTHWEVQRWDKDQVRTLCQNGPLSIALVEYNGDSRSLFRKRISTR